MMKILANALNWGKAVIAALCRAMFCHRAMHGALACLYGAVCAGGPKEVISYGVALCYAVLFVQG